MSGPSGRRLGWRELKRVRGDPGGEFPSCGGRLAGVARVDPIDVPAFFHAEIEAGGEVFTGGELGGRDEERDGEVLRGDRGLRAQQLEGRERETSASGRAKSDNRRDVAAHGDGS